MFFTKMAIRFLASTAFVLFYMGSSYGQCPNFTLKLEQPNPDLAVYDVILETPPGGLNNISTFNFEVNLSSGGTNIQAANPHPNISMSNMSGQGGNSLNYFDFVNTSTTPVPPLFSFSGPSERLFSVSFDGPVGGCVEISIASSSQLWFFDGVQLSFCNANISNSPRTYCIEGLEIAGIIETDGGSECLGSVNFGVPEVQIAFIPPGVPTGAQACTNTETSSNGIYSCDLVKPGHIYRVEPTKTNNPGCGITTLDLSLLHSHLLGVNDLDTYQKLIAADYNASGSISTLDKILLGNKILGKPNSDPAKSWRFFQSWDYGQLPNPPAATFTLSNLPSENYVYITLNSDVTDADFVGVKIGDINASCTDCTAPLTRPNLPNYSRDVEVEFVIPEVRLQRDDEYLLPIKIRGGDFILSMYGFGLRFDNEYLQLLDVISGDSPNFTLDNFNLDALKRGELRHVWLSETAEGHRFVDNSTLFYVKVKAKKAIESLSGLVKLDEQMIETIATFFMEKSYPVDFSISKEIEPKVFPNPFIDQVTFQLPIEGVQTIQIKVFDGTGRLLELYEELSHEDYFEWKWSPRSNLPPGVYYYRIEIGSSSSQGMLLKLK